MIPSVLQMEIALVKYFDERKCIIIPTVYGCFDHELDLCVIHRKTGYCVEVEIKRSVADMKADFKKKHTHKHESIAELYYAFPSKILEKCIPLVPKGAGIFEIRQSWKLEGMQYWKCHLIKKSKRQKSVLPLSNDQINRIINHGIYRFWSLKRKLRKYELQGND